MDLEVRWASERNGEVRDDLSNAGLDQQGGWSEKEDAGRSRFCGAKEQK